MNTKTEFLVCAALSILSAAAVLFLSNAIKSSDLFSTDVETLSKCEITRNDGEIIVFECAGEEGECSISHWGYTLTCSGGKQVKDKG